MACFTGVSGSILDCILFLILPVVFPGPAFVNGCITEGLSGWPKDNPKVPSLSGAQDMVTSWIAEEPEESGRLEERRQSPGELVESVAWMVQISMTYLGLDGQWLVRVHAHTPQKCQDWRAKYMWLGNQLECFWGTQTSIQFYSGIQWLTLSYTPFMWSMSKYRSAAWVK